MVESSIIVTVKSFSNNQGLNYMLTKPLIALSALLGYTEAQVAGAYVHDLDDNEHVQRISYTGLTLS